MEKRIGVLAYGLIVVGIFSRLLPHPPNMTPLVAVALFSGAYLPRRVAIVVPLSVMIISDGLIGFSMQAVFGWAAFAIVGCIGFLLRQRVSVQRLIPATLGSSTLFFFLSNFGVWLEGRLYPWTLSGLRACYLAGVPFYRNMLAGDVLYTAALFSFVALARSWQRQPATLSN